MNKLRPVFIDENGYTENKRYRLVHGVKVEVIGNSCLVTTEICNPPESVFASAEPVGYVPECMLKDMLEPKFREDRDLIPVFTYPPAPKPDVLLSNEEIENIADAHYTNNFTPEIEVVAFARAIEAAVLAKQKGASDV